MTKINVARRAGYFVIYLEKYLDRERSSKRNLMFHRISGSQNDCESSVRMFKSNLDFIHGEWCNIPSFSLFKNEHIKRTK